MTDTASTTPTALARPGLRALQGVIVVLIVIVFAFAVMRLLVDVPHLLDGTFPEEEYDRRYVQHPWLAYAHIAPGIVYLLGAPVQLAYRIRSRHYTFHRRLGRVLLTAGLISGAFAIALGYVMPFGGTGEAMATYVFGSWFLACLLLAFRAIYRDDVVNHRRWMIRAFAMGVGVGTIRLWLGMFQVSGLVEFQDGFDVAFWLAFPMHAAVAELWIRSTPHPGG
ncbi:MAG TPA: DUF2306 domain-containing protein [Actinophytocola sp.]|nr:DUF2306 domain-containing protein [Actinophytocola sp.]